MPSFHSNLSQRLAACMAAVAIAASAPTLAEATGKPHLDKAGIVCGEGEGRGVCQMFIVAPGAQKIVVKVGHERVTTNPGFGSYPRPYIVVPIVKSPGQLVRGDKCVQVQAVASNKHGKDRGKVKLCDAGHADHDAFVLNQQALYADYENF